MLVGEYFVGHLPASLHLSAALSHVVFVAFYANHLETKL